MHSDNSEELFPVVDLSGRVIGRATRGECHGGSMLLHPVVHLHVFNSRGELYLQRRPAWKDIQPGRWDTAVGGHVAWGERIDEALRREAREELGLETFDAEMVAVYDFRSEREYELVHVFRTCCDGEICPSDELDGGRFWTADELRASVGKGVLTPNFEGEMELILKESPIGALSAPPHTKPIMPYMLNLQNLWRGWADALLAWLGVTPVHNDAWDRWVAFLLVVFVAVLFDFLCRWLLLRGVRHVVRRTAVTWDDELFSDAVLGRGCHVVSAQLLLIVLPVIFDAQSEAHTVVMRLMQAYFIFTVMRFVNALLRALFRIAATRAEWQNKPIKGLRQTAQGIVSLICIILIVSVLIDRSPTFLLTGLGASAAVVMLIFRDSILGFVSGIQLSANDMLQVGDWISMPKYGADGTVEEVSLTTVKIRNFDNTIVTLPPYLLVSDSRCWPATGRSICCATTSTRPSGASRSTTPSTASGPASGRSTACIKPTWVFSAPTWCATCATRCPSTGR